MHQSGTGGGEGASDPTVGQERSASSDQTGRRLPEEIMTDLTADKEKQILDFAASAMFAQALVVDVFLSLFFLPSWAAICRAGETERDSALLLLHDSLPSSPERLAWLQRWLRGAAEPTRHELTEREPLAPA